MADADAKTAPKPPPNLRIADNEKRECDTCSHYERGKCALYSNLPVDDEWVCDSFKAGDGEDEDSEDEPQSKATNLREASRNALKKARAAREQASGSKPE